MNHTVTIAGLLLSAGVLAGLVAIAIGALMVFAAGMSDAGDDGTGKSGCLTVVAGLALLIGSLVGLLV